MNFSDFDNLAFLINIFIHQSQPRKAVIIAFDAPIDEDRKIPVRNYEIRLMASHLKDSELNQNFLEDIITNISCSIRQIFWILDDYYSFFITGYMLEVVRN